MHGTFRLASEDAEVLLTVLEPLARKGELADQRSARQRRADALVDVFTGAATWMDLPHAGGQRAQLSYVVNSDWAAGVEPPSLGEQLARDGQHPLALSSRTASGAWTGPQTRPGSPSPSPPSTTPGGATTHPSSPDTGRGVARLSPLLPTAQNGPSPQSVRSAAIALSRPRSGINGSKDRRGPARSSVV